MRLLSNSVPQNNAASIAQVSFSDSWGFGAVTSSESRGTSVFAPRGIMYRPCEGDRVLMLKADNAEICAGCLCVPDDIECGEIKICSAGGAAATFKNNGEIHLNGLIITKDGRIIEAAGR